MDDSNETLRLSFRPWWECDHQGISPSNNFDICCGCGLVVWKCKLDVERRIAKAMDELKKQGLTGCP